MAVPSKQIALNPEVQTNIPTPRKISPKQLEIAKQKKQPCFLFRNKLRVIFFLSLGCAIGVGTWYAVVHIAKEGFPITNNSNLAGTRFLLSCLFVSMLAISGYIILVAGVSSMFIGILYVFSCTATLYYCCNCTAVAYYALDDTFQDLVTHVKNQFDRTRELPTYINKIQEDAKCCGWGKIWSSVWPEIFGGPHLPDSCCIKSFRGCGQNLNPLLPSGNLYSVEKGYYDSMVSVSSSLLNSDLNCTRSIIGSAEYDLEKARNQTGVPSKILRKIDEWYFRRDMTGPICPVWEYNKGIDIFLYRPRGIEEFRRLMGMVFDKTCEENEQNHDPTDFSGYNDKFLGNLLNQMKFVISGGAALGLCCVLMAILFWYYYSRIQARELADAPPPRDFQELDIEAAAFEGENKFEDIDAETAAKLEKQEAVKRVTRLEKIRKKHSSKHQHEVNLIAEAAKRHHKKHGKDKNYSKQGDEKSQKSTEKDKKEKSEKKSKKSKDKSKRSRAAKIEKDPKI